MSLLSQKVHAPLIFLIIKTLIFLLNLLNFKKREFMYSQLDRRIQLQNLVADSIPRNSKFCVYPKVSVMDIDVKVTWISKRKLALSEVMRSRHIGHQPMIPYTGKKWAADRRNTKETGNFWGGKSWSFYLVVCRDFLLLILMGITEDKQSRHASEAGCLGTSYAGMDMEVQEIPEWIIPVARYTSNSSAHEFRRVLYPNRR